MRPWRVGAAVLSVVVAAVLVTAQDGPQPPAQVQAVTAVPAPAVRFHPVWPRLTPALTPSPHEDDSQISEISQGDPPAARHTTASESPVTTDPAPALEAGSGENFTEASFYSTAEMGTSTASDIALDDGAFTTAHRTLAMGTVLRVCYAGSCVRVTVTDRGPFVAGRDLDLSKAAFVALAGSTAPGVIRVSWSLA